MHMFGRRKRPPAQAPSPPRPAEQPYYDDNSLPPPYSRIDYRENQPFAAFSRDDMPFLGPAPVSPYSPPLPPRPSAIEPRAQSSIDLPARFNNVRQITSREAVQRHQSQAEFESDDSTLCDLITSKLNAVLTSIDGENFSGDVGELGMCSWPQHSSGP